MEMMLYYQKSPQDYIDRLVELTQNRTVELKSRTY